MFLVHGVGSPKSGALKKEVEKGLRKAGIATEFEIVDFNWTGIWKRLFFLKILPWPFQLARMCRELYQAPVECLGMGPVDRWTSWIFGAVSYGVISLAPFAGIVLFVPFTLGYFSAEPNWIMWVFTIFVACGLVLLALTAVCSLLSAYYEFKRRRSIWVSAMIPSARLIVQGLLLWTIMLAGYIAVSGQIVNGLGLSFPARFFVGIAGVFCFLLPYLLPFRALNLMRDVVKYLGPSREKERLFEGVLNSLGTLMRSDVRRIALVGHSLGSVLLVDLLRRGDLDRLRAEQGWTGEFHLFTMGSPLCKLALFCPCQYPSPVALRASVLESVETWDNLYRSWDYIGTRLFDREGETRSADVLIRNEPGKFWLHTNYWSNNEFLQFLTRRCRPDAAAAGSSKGEL